MEFTLQRVGVRRLPQGTMNRELPDFQHRCPPLKQWGTLEDFGRDSSGNRSHDFPRICEQNRVANATFFQGWRGMCNYRKPFSDGTPDFNTEKRVSRW